MGWLQPIIDFLRQFWPFEIVYSYQRGVRFWCGVDKAELDSGLYMFCPFFGKIEVIDSQPDVMRLANQDLTTKDGVPVSVSLNVLYEIHDARAAFVKVQKVTDNIADECRAGVAAAVRDCTFPELLARQGEIENEIADNVAKVAGEWGVQIHRVNFADFIRTRALSLTRSPW